MIPCSVGWGANGRQDQAPFSEQHQGAQGGCHCLTKGPKTSLLSAVCVCLLQMFLSWPFHFAFEYFTLLTLRELILHKIIMNLYKLVLINMNDVLFSKVETMRDTNAFDRHVLVFFNSKVFHFVPIVCSWWSLYGAWDYLSQLWFQEWFSYRKNVVVCLYS